MADPVTFTLAPRDHLWSLSKDGQHAADYSHLEQATHDAVRLARELEETGQPTQVLVHAADGKVIEIEVGPDVTQDEERRGPALAR